MKPKIKAQWISALRSGEYKQGKYKLRHSGRFCCLGVLCNLHAQAHPEIAATQKRRNLYMGEEGSLPAAVMQWAGLNKPGGNEVRFSGDWHTFAELNDDKKLSFAEIADVIEAQL